jgi:hypothetical protein
VNIFAAPLPTPYAEIIIAAQARLQFIVSMDCCNGVAHQHYLYVEAIMTVMHNLSAQPHPLLRAA